MNPSPAVFSDVEITSRIQRDAVRLVELARQLADPAQARQELAGRALDDIDLRVVLVDHEHKSLRRIA